MPEISASACSRQFLSSCVWLAKPSSEARALRFVADAGGLDVTVTTAVAVAVMLLLSVTVSVTL